MAIAEGDLTKRKLFPALYSLAYRQMLPEKFSVLGVARTEGTDNEFRERMKAAVQEFGRDDFREDVWQELADGMHYVYDEDKLAAALRDLGERRGTTGNRIYYLAVPPAAFEEIVGWVGKHKSRKGWTRVIVEKPFGHDLQSAQDLNVLLHKHFDESQIFRIDHYLGKETVQNMLALRFANGIFEPIWNRQFIDHIQITVAETLGIEGRAEYYERAGAIRDIFQNHLLQLIALTAMEPPIDLAADSVRNEKVKVLKSIHTPGPKHVVRGQYGRGYVEGQEVPGYREEAGVDPSSMTETFVAAKLFVDNWRWADTPFYIRAGKRMARRETTIAIEFKRAPHPPFVEVAAEGLRPNVLLIHIQPDEGVSLAIGAKVPGQGLQIRTVHMDFLYRPAGGLRAAAGRLHARRRFSVHARGRGGRAVGDRRRDRRLLATRPAFIPELRRRNLGPAQLGRAYPARRALMASTLIKHTASVDGFRRMHGQRPRILKSALQAEPQWRRH